jgi:hypothetical protein
MISIVSTRRGSAGCCAAAEKWNNKEGTSFEACRRNAQNRSRRGSGRSRVKYPSEAAKPTRGGPAALTGRDGVVDLVARAAALEASEPAVLDQTDRFSRMLGAAAISLWSDLPQPIQEQLFERAVFLGHRDERDEMQREQLAKFLHDRHKRTLGDKP